MKRSQSGERQELLHSAAVNKMYCCALCHPFNKGSSDFNCFLEHFLFPFFWSVLDAPLIMSLFFALKQSFPQRGIRHIAGSAIHMRAFDRLVLLGILKTWGVCSRQVLTHSVRTYYKRL